MRRFLQCNTPNWETPTLTPEEVEYLEELYVPHPLTSVVRPSVEAKK